MEAKEPTGSHCGVKSKSHNTSLRTWFYPCVSSCRSASLCPRLPAFHHHWCLQSGTTLNVFSWIYFSENRIQITVLWLHSANWPLLWMTYMEWGWANWRWKGGLWWGQREVSMAWGTVSHTTGERRGGCRVWGSPRWRCARWLFHFEGKKIGLSHFSASSVQTPTAARCFSVIWKLEYTESLAESSAGEIDPTDVCA